ncbi:uncharacterized protein LOC104002446 isoform X6 [Pan troglodytes]|uniref:uncharacterized protein LOC104002446 isoform X6 n=1 Tax=Pan troglodytes TaxID=9598 RepID=UPI0007DBC3DB|nr:uncharacterized protein LOC104002446 isoform X5 [Pan troglodytes]XP_054523138.1 uncharacterized protein LOC104002446 isoform X5 [Pan troglodytes]
MCVPLTPSSLFLSLCLCRLSRWLFKNEEPLLECSGQSAELLLKSARRGCNRQQKGKRLPEIRTPAPPPRPMVPVPLGIILYATSSQEWQAVESLAFVGPLDIWQRTRKPRFPSVSPSAGKLQAPHAAAVCRPPGLPGEVSRSSCSRGVEQLHEDPKVAKNNSAFQMREQVVQHSVTGQWALVPQCLASPPDTALRSS